MKSQTLIGLLAGLVLIFIGILLDGSILSFIDVPSIMIVFGGTIASTVMSYSPKQIKNIFPLVKKAFINPKEDVRGTIDKILELANIARREGLLALDTGDYDDPFLQKGVELIVDGTDPEMVRNILESELDFTEERHQKGQHIFKSMAAFAPAYGMTGTLIGLINMLRKLDDPGSLGPSMAVALVTTFYGVVLANLVFIPIVNKLSLHSSQELLRKEMIIEGLLSIQNGENPRIIKDKLEAFIERNDGKKKPAAKQNVEMTLNGDLNEQQ